MPTEEAIKRAARDIAKAKSLIEGKAGEVLPRIVRVVEKVGIRER
jgi:hypothetical protein